MIETKTHCAAALGWKLVGGEIDLKTNSPSPLLPLFPRQHVFGVFLSRVIVPPTGQPPGGVVSPFFLFWRSHSLASCHRGVDNIGASYAIGMGTLRRIWLRLDNLDNLEN